MSSIIGIALSLTLLMSLAYRGISVLVLAPLCALTAVLFSPGTPLLASYTQVFMSALGHFLIAYFPLFLLGSVFGKLMDDSGAARTLAQGIVRALGARHAILAVVLACAVLTYGGVSLFVVAFAVYPIATALFRQADIPKRLIPATIALGAFTFTMTALPGTPAIQNAIPMPYFGTTPFAAPGLGLIASLVMLGAGLWWLHRRARTAQRQREGYGQHDDGLSAASGAVDDAPPLWMALAPIVVVIMLNYVLSSWFWPGRDTHYLGDTRYGSTSIQALLGLWAVIGALAAAIVVLLVLLGRRIPQLKQSLEQGANASALPLLNTASQVGFGAVIASLAGFGLIREAVLGIAPETPLVSISVAVNILAGITGSASGGMSIALQTLGNTWLSMAQAAGIAPDLLHRVTTIATGGLDALPHNGAVITLLALCKLDHKQSYSDIFMTAALFPLASLLVVVMLGTWLGSF